jgi:hypothetical protein
LKEKVAGQSTHAVATMSLAYGGCVGIFRLGVFRLCHTIQERIGTDPTFVGLATSKEKLIHVVQPCSAPELQHMITKFAKVTSQHILGDF